MTEKKLNKTEASILRGIQDALAYVRGDAGRGIAHVVKVPKVDVKSARRKLGMTQKDFARNFGVSLDTVRNWEQGRRQPEGAARVLLAVIERNPVAVLEVVRNAA
ncbi:MAG: hypothetical protein A3G18_01295 [Rhodospirillales bacterium RIFCSPLOWO2_12_FULL_58_28]|nr:MAG: hypothetical protein A3H92_04495 [Rhodospirillales bacterium RIFCSPLOWO2_02_FULL_58_16]OHC78036.1 MAG: hypothetical protein A3G18_01295 [Rhodospirillales bacterium RIFCSPLOWO2_12_FULL_58_28]